jgi:hypothetical protein
VPLFNDASKIYAQKEIDLLRRCFGKAGALLAETGGTYQDADLAASLIRLYDYSASCKREANTSADVLNPSHLRGVALRSWARALNCAWLTCVRSALLGK